MVLIIISPLLLERHARGHISALIKPILNMHLQQVTCETLGMLLVRAVLAETMRFITE